MFSLAWHELRRRPGALLGAIVMTVVGAALIMAFTVLYTSIDETRAPVERYAGTPVVTTGSPGMFTPEMVRHVAEVDGVARVVPELSFPVQLLTASGAPVVSQSEMAQLGHSWESAGLTPFEIIDGSAPTTSDQVVIDEGLAQRAGIGVGARVPVDIGGAVEQASVSGVARAPVGQMHQHSIFFAAPRAEELAGRGQGRVDAVGIVTEQRADPASVASDIRQYLTTALTGNVTAPSGLPVFQVAFGADRGEIEGILPSHRATAQAMVMLVWIVVAMAVVVIAGALVSSVRRRTAHIALIRAVGATPRQIRLLCQAEALLVAAVAALIGLPVGALLGWALVALARTTSMVSPVLTFHVSPASITMSVILIVVVTQLAAWWTSRAALRTRPGDLNGVEISTPRTRRTAVARTVAGVLVILAAGVVQAMGMAGALPASIMGTYGFIASLLIIVGVALLGSLLVWLLAASLRRLGVKSSPASRFLAIAQVAHHRRRYAGVSVPMTVGITLAGWAMVGLPLYALANGNAFADRIAAQTIVVDTPLVRDQHTGLSPQARQRLARTDGVTSTAGFWEGWVAALPAGTEAKGSALTWGIVATGEIGRQLALGAIDGHLEDVESGHGVALARSYASSTGSGIGSDVQVRLPGAGKVTTLPVVALYDGSANGDHGLIVSQQAVADAVGSRWSDYLLVSGTMSASSVDAALASQTVGVANHDRIVDSYVQGRSDIASSPGTIGIVMVGMFLILASVNALVLAQNDRIREISALRRLNVTPGEARRMVAWELLLTVVPACLLGLVAVAWMAFTMAGGDLSATAWAYPFLPLVSVCVATAIATVGAALIVVDGLQRRIAHRMRGVR